MNEYKILFVAGIFLCLLAFIFTFLGCWAIAYNNCDGELSFSHYESVPLEIGIAVVPSPGPVFVCDKDN